jgi:hypothetical protein
MPSTLAGLQIGGARGSLRGCLGSPQVAVVHDATEAGVGAGSREGRPASQLRGALKKLPDELKAVLDCRFVSGSVKTQAEASRELGVSERTLRDREKVAATFVGIGSTRMCYSVFAWVQGAFANHMTVRRGADLRREAMKIRGGY